MVPLRSLSILKSHPSNYRCSHPRARRCSVSTPCRSVACTTIFQVTNGYTIHHLPHLTSPSGIIPTRN